MKNNKHVKNGFTLMEMLVVIVIIGIIIAIVIPTVSTLNHNRTKKILKTHLDMVDMASGLYIDQNKGTLVSSNKECFEINYVDLLQEGLTESDIKCEGVIVVTRSGNGFIKKNYLNCKDSKGNVISKSEEVPKNCYIVSNNVVVNHDLFTDAELKHSYDGKEYKKEIFMKLSFSNSSDVPLDYYEYRIGNIEYKKIGELTKISDLEDFSNKEYGGRIYVRAVDKKGNFSDDYPVSFKIDNKGPKVSLSYNSDKTLIVVKAEDKGSGLANDAYSFDGGKTWQSSNTKPFDPYEYYNIIVRDKLGNMGYENIVGKPKPIICKSGSANKVYDGTPLTSATGGNCTGLRSGHTAVFTENVGTVTNVGTAENIFGNVVIKDSDGTDVTSNYVITKENGTLKVNPRSIEVSWGTVAFEYNGSTQGPTASATTGVSGETINITRTTETSAGSYTSTASCNSVTGGQAKCSNYTITNPTKNFDIAPKPITCTSSDDSKTYNGKALTSTTGGNCTNLVSGHVATLSGHTGTITNAGSTANTFGSVVIKSGSTDVTSNYNITKLNGTLNVTPKTITVSWGTTTSFTYNGSEQAPTASATSGIAGETINITRTTGTNAGSYTSTASCSSVTGGQAKCSNYTLTGTTKAFTINSKILTVPSSPTDKIYTGSSQASGITCPAGSTAGGTTNATNAGAYTQTCTLTTNYKWSDGTTTDKSITWKITAKSVAVSWGTTSFTYNGTAQAPIASVTSGITGETINIKRTTETKAGDYTSIASCSSVTGGQAKCSNYTLTGTTKAYSIGKKAVTYTAGSGSKTYDGSALTNTGCTLSSGTLVSGHTVTCSISGSQTNKGTSTNTLSSVTIKSGSTDVSSNYEITKANGTLTVNARAVTYKASDGSKTYDGSALTNSGCILKSGTLVSGHTVTCSISGSQTNKGSSTNTLNSVTIKSGSIDVSSNYEITKANGTLTVNARTVTYTAGSATKIYDGSALTNSGCTLSSGTLASGHTATCSISGIRTNKGTSTNTLSSVTIKSGSTDVSSNYAITKVNGTLTVSARGTTCTSGSASKIYDGTALTSTSTGSCTDLVSGHMATFSGHTGTITNVGSTANTFGSVVIKSGTTDVSSNYSITKVNGTLTVNPQTDATLKSLGVTGYSISPTFASGTTDYSLTVPNNITSVTITATANASAAKVTGTGSKSLNIGINYFSITVTAQNGSIKTYTISITRIAKTLGQSLAENYPIVTSGNGRYTVATTSSGQAATIFKGDNTSNANLNINLSFAGYKWKIYGINNDGTLRAIMTTATSTSGAAYASASGFTYQTSNAKSSLDSWYSSNLASYSSYLATGGYFCTTTYSSTSSSSNLSLACDSSNVVSSNIGLITKQEFLNMGGTLSTSQTGHYMVPSDGSTTWTMTFFKNNSNTIFVIDNELKARGNGYQYGTSTNKLRPVIILKDTIDFSGTGTSSNPYCVPKNSCN